MAAMPSSEEQPTDFMPLFSFLLTLMEYGGHLIHWPG